MKKHESSQNSLISKITILVVALLAFLFILSLVKNLAKVRRVEEITRQKEERIRGIEKKNEEIRKKLEEVKSEASIEKKLRDDLGLVREGEVVFVLPEESVLRSLVPTLPEEAETLPDPVWKKWLKLFGVNI